MGKLKKSIKQILGFEEPEKEVRVEDEIIINEEEKEDEVKNEEEDLEPMSMPLSFDIGGSKKVYETEKNISDYQTIFVNPTGFEECKKIANYINKEKIVTINLEELSNEEAQRLLDFLSGAMEVKKARFITVSKKVYVSVPDGIKSYVEEETNEIFR